MKSRFDGETRLVGIIGWPVEHSASPAMHNAALQSMGLNWRYLPLAVEPGELRAAVERIRAMRFAGANVTLPHKEAIVHLLDELSPVAKAMGAVNLIVRKKNGTLLGDNTDAQGFLVSLSTLVPDLRSRRVAVLGSGGAARAVVCALAQTGAIPVLFARRPHRALKMMHELRTHNPEAQGTVHSFRNLDRIGEQESVLVHATPVGMWPDVKRSPWPDDLPIPNHLVVCDLVYNPTVTRLLARATGAGCQVLDGRGMLVEQAALSLEAWTGCPAPRGVMAQACEEFLNPTKHR